MRTLLKQFAGLVIALRNNIFLRGRFRLTILAVIVVTGFIGFFHVAFNHAHISDVRQILEGKTETAAIEEVIENFKDHERVYEIIIFVSSIFLAYFLSGFVLKPIESTLESQRRFIYDASHELRTPLSVMKTNTELALMEGNELSCKQALAALGENLEEVDRMAAIIKNLVGLSHTDSSWQLNLQSADFSEVVLRSLNLTQSAAQRKKIKISTRISSKCMVRGNFIALEEMAINILKNAITYTTPNGRIYVTLAQDDKYIQFTTQDTGIGIDHKSLPHIFEPFFRSDRARRYKNGSSGLGLAIVKDIVEKHRGSVSVRSTPKKGSTFIIKIPAWAEPASS